MDNNTLLSLVTAKAQEWLKGNYDAETKAEVQKMLDLSLIHISLYYSIMKTSSFSFFIK